MITDFAFPILVKPLAGESALSFISRLADWNGFQLITLLRDIASMRRPDAWTDQDWNRLAIRSGTTLEELSPLRRMPANIKETPSAIMFLGKPMRPRYLVKSNVRLCPSCIKQRPVLKEIWSLCQTVACPDHGTLLVDTCQCGRHINTMSRGLNPFQCPCGTYFEDLPSNPASEAALNASRWLLQSYGINGTAAAPERWLSKEGRLDKPFSTMEPHDIMGVIDTIGLAATTPASEDEAVVPQKSWRRGSPAGRKELATNLAQVEAAIDVLHNWPFAYHNLLAKVAGRNGKAGRRRPRDLFATRIGQIMLTPYRGLDGQPIAALQKEVDAFLVSQGYDLRKKVHVRNSITARYIYRTMPCSKIAEKLGISVADPKLTSIYGDVVSKFDDILGDNVDREQLGQNVYNEVSRRLSLIKNYISPNALSQLLSHPRSNNRWDIWERAGLLKRVLPDKTAKSKVKHHVFWRSDALYLERKMRAVSQLVKAIPDAFQPYEVVSKACVDAEYQGRDLLLDILAGAVPTVRTVCDPTLSDLYVDMAAGQLRSLEKRTTKIIRTDQFAATSKVESVLSKLWPTRPEKLTIPINRDLRERKLIRSEARTNRTEGRERPLYWYSIVDHMLRARRKFGPSILPAIDAQLAELNRLRPSHEEDLLELMDANGRGE